MSIAELKELGELTAERDHIAKDLQKTRHDHRAKLIAKCEGEFVDFFSKQGFKTTTNGNQATAQYEAVTITFQRPDPKADIVGAFVNFPIRKAASGINPSENVISATIKREPQRAPEISLVMRADNEKLRKQIDDLAADLKSYDHVEFEFRTTPNSDRPNVRMAKGPFTTFIGALEDLFA